MDRNTNVSSLDPGSECLPLPLHVEGGGGVSVALKDLLPGVLMVGKGPTKGLEVIRAHTLQVHQVPHDGVGRLSVGPLGF